MGCDKRKRRGHGTKTREHNEAGEHTASDRSVLENGYSATSGKALANALNSTVMLYQVQGKYADKKYIESLQWTKGQLAEPFYRKFMTYIEENNEQAFEELRQRK